MRSAVNATVVFGLVNIPVGLAPATTTNEIKFKNMHDCGSEITTKTTGEPGTVGSIKQHRFCEACGVEVDEVVHGYEYDPGLFISFTDEELATVRTPQEKVITLTKFVPRTTITPIMVEKDYFLIPSKSVPNSYGLLYQTLAEMKLVGIGSEALWQNKEHPCAIVADQSYTTGVLMMQVLRVAEDMIQPDFEAPIPGVEEKKLAKQIITGMKGELDPGDLVSLQRAKMNELVQAKLKGIKIEKPVEAGEVVVSGDLMASLKASVAAQEKSKPKQKAKAKG